jgi:hypothetical protein
MKIKMIISVASAWEDTNAGLTIDVPDDVGAEWCRIGYASPATPAATEKASSKVIPEVRKNGNQGQNSGSDTTDNRTSDTARGKKPSKD